jgi:hypothetical protein
MMFGKLRNSLVRIYSVCCEEELMRISSEVKWLSLYSSLI